MHPNPVYRGTSKDRNLAFARDRAFGTLAVAGAAGPLLSHVPFDLSDDGGRVELHLVRSNPIAGVSGAAVLAVIGPDGYVSPDWYGMADQVPTWNYVAVHLRGRLERLPDAALRPMLDRLAARFESRLAPKPAWRSDKMTPGVMERMMRAIVPFALHVEHVDGTWKLSQNKPADVRLGAADGVAGGVGVELTQLARLMRQAE